MPVLLLVDGEALDGALAVLVGGECVAAGGLDAVAEDLGHEARSCGSANMRALMMSVPARVSVVPAVCRRAWGVNSASRPTSSPAASAIAARAL